MRLKEIERETKCAAYQNSKKTPELLTIYLTDAANLTTVVLVNV